MFNSMRDLLRQRPIASFFVLALGFTWMLWGPVALSSQGLLPYQLPFSLFILAGYGPSLAGIFMTYIEEGKSGVQKLFKRLLQWQAGIRWYAFVLSSTAFVAICVAFLYPLLGNKPAQIDYLAQLGSLLSILPLLILVGGPLSEELGWRGFALPKLLAGHNALVSSLILGAVWGLWHLPAFWIQGAGQQGQPILWFMIGAPAVSILYTWIYKHTEGSLLIAVMYHTAFDSTLYFASPAYPSAEATTDAFMLAVILLWLMALIVVALFGPQHLSESCNPQLAGESSQHQEPQEETTLSNGDGLSDALLVL